MWQCSYFLIYDFSYQRKDISADIFCHCVLFKTATLTEVDEKASIALALVLWKNHDA